MILSRFSCTMPDTVARVRFVDRQDYDGFLRLNSLFDVSLDPPDFGGGNTSYEAFAMGTPIVTKPSPFLRGRITFALYQAMGIDDCIAATMEQYVDLAVRLGTDKRYRQQIHQKILDANHTLFENAAGIREFEAFLQNVVPR